MLDRATLVEKSGRWSTVVVVIDAVAAASRAVDRGVTWCLTATDGDRRRAAAAGVVVFVALHLRPEIVRYRSRLIDVDRRVVDAGRLVA